MSHLRSKPRGTFDLVPQRSGIMPVARPMISAGSASTSGAQGYTLGGGASASTSRQNLQKENEVQIGLFKEKEREKKLKKLDEKLKRYAHLDTAPGQTLNEDASDTSLDTVRELQSVKNREAIESHKLKELELEALETQKKLDKLKEKINKYSYLNTAPGQKLLVDAPESMAAVREINDAADPIRELKCDLENEVSFQNHTETLQSIDNDKAMREMRRRLQDNYNSSVKGSSQAKSD